MSIHSLREGGLTGGSAGDSGATGQAPGKPVPGLTRDPSGNRMCRRMARPRIESGARLVAASRLSPS